MKKALPLLLTVVLLLGMMPQFVLTARGSAKSTELDVKNLRFDDHVDMTGKTVEIVDAGTPTSYQVGYGVEENTVRDTAVVALKGDTLVATGIGTAKVKIDGAIYEITVTSAPISLLLLIGQSNMRGSEGDANQSIVCPDGMVYASFGDERGDAEGIMNENNATNFAASALTGAYSTINVNGTTSNLSYYPINSLTEAGKGTFGPDSGFAYEWVKQTGEKVWVVNAAHGGSSITSWQPNATNYKEAVLLFAACQETLRKEIAAGHFTLSHMGYFWCQGCSDYNWTAEKYVASYLAMHNGLKSALTFDHDSDGATASRVFEFAGIIPVRAGNDNNDGYRKGVYADTTSYALYESFKDLQMTGPRVAQYWMCNNPELEDIWLVCNAGEDWVWMPDGTNGVSAYFQSRYPNGTVDYTTQVKQNAAWYTPTTPAAVHDSIHYNQIGYNEVGRESARNALIMLGEIAVPEVETTVELLSWDGYTPVTNINGYKIGNSETLIVPKVSPVWKSKDVTYTLSENLSWPYYDLLTTDETLGGMLSASTQNASVTVSRGTPNIHFADHLSLLPADICSSINLWEILEHDPYYYCDGKYWGTSQSGEVTSITIPVNPGDKIYASSFGAAGTNGNDSINGIRVTYFNVYGVQKTTSTDATYAEFAYNGGYLIAPEGAVAINIPMWTASDDWKVYLLNKDHDCVDGQCMVCGYNIVRYNISPTEQKVGAIDSRNGSVSNWETNWYADIPIPTDAVQVHMYTMQTGTGKYKGSVFLNSDQTMIPGAGHYSESNPHWTYIDIPETATVFRYGNNYSHQDGVYVEFAVRTVHTHNETSVVKAATCTEGGSITYNCSDCGNVRVEYTDKVWHKNNGSGVCSVCGCTLARLDAATVMAGKECPAAVHATTGEVVRNPSWDTTWFKDIQIPAGATGVAFVTLKSNLGYGSVFLDANKEFIPGSGYTSTTAWAQISCDIPNNAKYLRYGQNYLTYGNDGEYIEFAIHAHQYTSVVTAPSCTTKGYTTYTCACGHSYKDNYVGNEDKHHVNENGKCKNCGLSIVSVPLNGLDKRIGSAVFAQTGILSTGWSTKSFWTADIPVPDGTVSVQFQSMDNDELKYGSAVYAMDGTYLAGHTTGAYYPTINMALTEDAAIFRYGQHYDCTQAILFAVEGHDFEAVVTAPTCAQKGYTTYQCKDCDYSYVSYSGNERVAHVEENGKCKNCGLTIVSMPISSLTKQTKKVLEAATGKVTFIDAENCWISDIEIPKGAVAVQFLAMQQKDAKYGSSVYAADGDVVAFFATKEYPVTLNLTLPENAVLFRYGQNWDSQTPILFIIHDHVYDAVVTAPTCTVGGYTTYICPCGHSYIGDEVASLEHNYLGGICSGCGIAEPVLYVAEVNGENYMTLGEAIVAARAGDTVTLLANTEEAVTVAKPLTIVKGGFTANLTAGQCYAMTDSEQTVTFTLNHKNVSYVDNGNGTHDGSCECGALVVDDQTHSYENGICSCGLRDIRGVSRAKSLILEGAIIVKSTIAFTDAEKTMNAAGLSKEYILENGQILFWSLRDMPTDPAAAVLGTQTSASKLTAASVYEGIQEYYGESHGIPAKEYNDTIYYRTYIVVDGKEYYGDIIEYSVVTYCENQLKKTTTKANEMKPLLAAMLNYGAAAQQHFNYKTNELANACLQKYVDQGLLDAEHLVMHWDANLLTALVDADENMKVNFPENNAKRTAKTLRLEGAVEVKMTFAYQVTDDKGTQLPDGASVTVYFWNSKTYEALKAAGEALTKENATSVRTGEEITSTYSANYGYEYAAFSEGAPAKELGDTVYAAAVFTMADGTEYCSGVCVYSAENYAEAKLEAANAAETLKNVVKWMVIYGEAAKNYFASR